MSDARFGVGRVPDLVPDVVTAVGRPAVLGRSQLVVQVREDRGLVFLDVRSRVDPAQSFLLSLDHRPDLAGLTSFTRLGAIHALYWSLAFGVGTLPDDALVRFESGTLRYDTTVDSVVHPLTRGCWVAHAGGVFASARLLVGDRERLRVRLTEQP